MKSDAQEIFWLAFTIGACVAIVALVILQMIAGVYDEPSHDSHEDECVLITPNETLLTDPEYGEDDGMVYCPTGEVSVSQLGRVVK